MRPMRRKELREMWAFQFGGTLYIEYGFNAHKLDQMQIGW